MTPWAALAVMLGIAVGSVIVHEAGHVLTTKALGGTYHGLVWRWYGVGVQVEPPPGKLWLTALGGLGATALLALGFLAAGVMYGFLLNAVLLASNLIPHRALDGGHVLAHFRR